MNIRWIVLLVFFVCMWTRNARAFEGALELELNTPADPIFSETVWNPEYEWRKISDIGRLAGHGFYEWSDVTREWFTRHSASWAPFEKTPFLAAAVEYGASGNGEFWQGGAAFIASRLPQIKGVFDYLSLAYFTDIRDARFSSEWVLLGEITFLRDTLSRRLVIEGVYRYRPAAERADDSGVTEIWWYSNYGDAAGLVFGKAEEQWVLWLGYRMTIF